MADHLEQASPDDLLWELRRREALAVPGATASGMKAVEELADLETETLVGALVDRQKVIYGVDDRQDLFAVTDQAVLRDADSVVALFTATDLVDNGDGTSTIDTINYGDSYDLCPSERFREQPTGPFCSGFLVAPDLVATAGHCVGDDFPLPDIRFLFGFRMADATTPPTTVSNAEIYRGERLLGRRLTDDGTDWSLVQLDRAVSNHPPVRVRMAGRIAGQAPVHVIGHPSGLPTKYAPGANVRDNSSGPFFVANLDTYGGNSGSAVFHSATHVVEGILVRGENDYVTQGNCQVSLVCPSTGCRGEDVTRAPEFAPLVTGYTIALARHSRQALDVRQSSTADGTEVIQWPFHGANNQRFRAEPLGDGHHRIVANHSGKVLEVEGASTSAGARVVQASWTGADSQRWRLESLDEGYSRLIAKHSGKVLEVEDASTDAGARTVQSDWHGGDSQRWRLGAAPALARHSGQALDVHRASTENRAPLTQWPFHGRDNQLFRVERLQDGYYRIVAVHSGKVLDVERASKDNGARVIQWDWHGDDNQRFRLEPVGGGYYRVRAKHSGKVLDVQRGSNERGAQVVQWRWHGGRNQRWRINVT
jgi:Ricin-type beta-trefoil lectin domain-like/Trypsin-like peptidase domain